MSAWDTWSFLFCLGKGVSCPILYFWGFVMMWSWYFMLMWIEGHMILKLVVWDKICCSPCKFYRGICNRFTICLLYFWSWFTSNTLVIIFWRTIESQMSFLLIFCRNYFGYPVWHWWRSVWLFLSTFSVKTLIVSLECFDSIEKKKNSLEVPEILMEVWISELLFLLASC